MLQAIDKARDVVDSTLGQAHDKIDDINQKYILKVDQYMDDYEPDAQNYNRK